MFVVGLKQIAIHTACFDHAEQFSCALGKDE